MWTWFPFVWSSINSWMDTSLLSHSSSLTRRFVGLCCCHGPSPSLSAVVVSIIHHLHSQAIYTSFYSQSVFPLCWLHLSTPIQIFHPVYAIWGCLWLLGLKRHRCRSQKCIQWLLHLKASCYHRREHCCIVNSSTLIYKMELKLVRSFTFHH